MIEGGGFHFAVRHRNLEEIAHSTDFGTLQLFQLVRHIPRGGGGTECMPLDRLGEDHGRSAVPLTGFPVGIGNLDAVVATSSERFDLVVAP